MDSIQGCRNHHMMKEERKHGKFKHYILAPFRILNKARQLYMKGVVECAGGYGYGGALSPAAVHHYIPPSRAETNGGGNLYSWRTSGGDDDEGQSDEAEPIKNAEHERSWLVVQRQRRQQFVGYKYIGRIEEDQLGCYFEEDHQMDVKTHLLYLYPRRRRSNVVSNKSSTVYYQ